jgi:hypothetical protein
MQVGSRDYPGPYTYPGTYTSPGTYGGLVAVPEEFDTNFYVGPLGNLMPLPGTEDKVDTPLTVVGGTHMSLTGAFTRDRFGYKRSWTWNYPLLTARQAQFVEALQRNMVPGPLFLLDPRRPNRLPEQIASGGSLLRTPSGFIPSNTTTCLWRPLTYPAATAATLPASPILRGCLEWQLLAAGGAGLELAGLAVDGRHNIPVMPGEVLETSLWASGPPQAALSGTAHVYNAAGVELETHTLNPVQLSLTTWLEVGTAFTCPPGAAYLRLTLAASSASPIGSIFITAYQVAKFNPEYVPGLRQFCDEPDFGGWSLGGGAPQVIPDIGATGYLRAALQSSALTLIER